MFLYFLIFQCNFILIANKIITFSYTHIYKSKRQQFIDYNTNIKIQFDYEPDKPIIDNFTELHFKDLETAEYIKNFDVKSGCNKWSKIIQIRKYHRNKRVFL
jgi:hypothetical protein